MTETYDLSKLDSNSFEHMVNFLALKILGNGVTGFAPGADGGRDGFFSGEAPYPSPTDKWSGIWYVQSKFHKPHLSTNPQKWLIREVQNEIEIFLDPKANRTRPDNWIIATNIEPSGAAKTGAFDSIKKKVNDAFGKSVKVEIWGGRRILDFLAADPKVAHYYGHFLTPGNILSAIFEQINDATAQIKDIIDYLIVNQFNEQIYTKLEQAGSSSDSRPKIHQLFIDLPYRLTNKNEFGFILNTLVTSSSNNHRISAWNEYGDTWSEWSRAPRRARVFVLKGGPGQGKSTIGQYFSQIQRAALILAEDAPKVVPTVIQAAKEFKAAAEATGFWPIQARIPITIELKDFAKWYGNSGNGIISYLAEKISLKVEQEVLPGTLKRALGTKSWFVNFDGLDEVPNDVKDSVASEILRFTNEILPSIDADILTLCTTRPQGYSGQFESLEGANILLSNLPKDIALNCAAAVVKFGRTEDESENSLKVLTAAMESHQVRELMTTPLQSHIMAVVVRDGGRPPEKRWQLFDNFYQVMKKRESLKDFPDPRISKLLRENEQLLKAIHARLGISLHARAENSDGAETTLNRSEFKKLAEQTTSILMDENIEPMVETLMEATMERLVFVNTPENGENVRFDIRQLQEFFAAEFIYSGVAHEELRSRVGTICADSHWREVMHFILSALVVTNRTTELTVAIEVLHSEDEDTDCHNLRTFKRKMAAGSLLALRLLNEGILEQDKRVRQKFAKVIEPLYGICDPSPLSTITTLDHPNSLAWMTSCIIDHLLESSETESIGAAIALAQVMQNDNPRKDIASCKIFKSSANYLNYIYKSLTLNDHFNNTIFEQDHPTTTIQPWFIKETILLVTDSAIPHDLDLKILFKILSRNHEQAISICRETNLTIDEINLFALLITPKSSPGQLNRKADTNSLDSIYTCISLQNYTYTWRSKHPHPETKTQPEELSSKSPLIKLAHSLCMFIQTKNKDNFLKLLNIMSIFSNQIDIIPMHLQACIPVNFYAEDIDKQIKFLSQISETQFSKLISTNMYLGIRFNPVAEYIKLDEKFTVSGWKKICRDLPLIAVDLWMQPFGNLNDKEFESSTTYSTPIIKIVKETPETLGNHVLSLGRLFKLHPSEEIEIRQALLTCQPYDIKFGIRFSRISPFQIDLQKEINLLPLFANAIASMLETSAHHIKHLDESSLDYDEDFLVSFGLSITLLQSTYNDKDLSSLHRAAALSCYLMLRAESNTIDNFFTLGLDELFRNLTTQNLPAWFLSSAKALFVRDIANFDIRSQKFWGSILNTHRQDYFACDSIQKLIMNLRERSSAPVHTHKTLTSWLST